MRVAIKAKAHQKADEMEKANRRRTIRLALAQTFKK